MTTRKEGVSSKLFWVIATVTVVAIIGGAVVTYGTGGGGEKTTEPSKLSSVTVEVGDYASDNPFTAGYASMRVVLEGEEDNYNLTLSGPSKDTIATASVSLLEMADGRESVLLPMVTEVERFSSPEPGTYTLVIGDSAGNVVYRESFTYSGADLSVKSWGPPEFSREWGGYWLENVPVTVVNNGALPAYVTDLEITIDGEKGTGSGDWLRHSPEEMVVLPGETDTVHMTDFSLGPLAEGTHSVTYALKGYGNETLATHSTEIRVPRNAEKLLENLVVSFIDVGQGDSIYIKTPSGNDVLIDGGPKTAGIAVVAYLQSQGGDDLELVIATHPDADHVGGLMAVLDSFVVEEVWDPGFRKDTATYRDFVAAVDAEECPFIHPRRGSAIDVDPYLEEEVLNPPEALYSDSNDSSIVIRIEFENVSFLFTGDIGESVESDIMAEGFEVSSTILKVAHHGSKYSSSIEFLGEVRPKVAVISVGGDNPYGHPPKRL